MNWLKRRIAHWLINEIHTELKTRPAAGYIEIPPSLAIMTEPVADESS